MAVLYKNLIGNNYMKLKFFTQTFVFLLAAISSVQPASRQMPDATTIKLINKAATNGDVPQLESFYAAGYDIHLPDGMGKTPLHNAAFYGHIDAVNFLLRHGADVSAINDEQDTALHMATMESYAQEILEATRPAIAAKKELRNHHAVVLALLDAKANPISRNKLGNTPMHNVMMYCFEEIFQTMQARGRDALSIRNNAGVLPMNLSHIRC